MVDRELTAMNGVKSENDARSVEEANIVSTMEEIARDSYKRERFSKYFFEFHQGWKESEKRLKSDSHGLTLWNSKVVHSPEIKLHDILDKEFLGAAINYFDENNLFLVADLSEEALLAFMYYSNVGYKKFKKILEQIFVENHDVHTMTYKEDDQLAATTLKNPEMGEQQTNTTKTEINRVVCVENVIKDATEIKDQFRTYDKNLTDILDNLKFIHQEMNSQEKTIQNHEKQLISRADMISTLRHSNQLLATEKENLNNDLENWKNNHQEQSKLWEEEKELLQKKNASLQQELSIRNQLLNDRDMLIEELKEKLNETNEKLEKSQKDLTEVTQKYIEIEVEAGRSRDEAENSRNQLAVMVQELQMKIQALVMNEKKINEKETEIVDLKAQLEESQLSVKEVHRVQSTMQRLLAIFRGEKQSDAQKNLEASDKQAHSNGSNE